MLHFPPLRSSWDSIPVDPKKHYRRALTIAGSDSSGGAGIQADLKTFSALGCYGMSVVTALTAQNTQGVTAIHDVPVDFIEQQIRAVVEDVGVDAVKIGMLHSVEIIECVTQCVTDMKLTNVVVDPVIVAKGGDRLLAENAVESLRDVMAPLASVLTPNLPEAEMLLERSLRTRDDVQQAAADLCLGENQAVVIKGGRGVADTSDDCLCTRNENGSPTIRWFNQERVKTVNMHGAGCTFSSAIAAQLAHGRDKVEAITLAKEYTTGAITAGAHYKIGAGHGPVHHFFDHWSS